VLGAGDVAAGACQGLWRSHIYIEAEISGAARRRNVQLRHYAKTASAVTTRSASWLTFSA